MKCYFCGNHKLRKITTNYHVSKEGTDVLKCKNCEVFYDYPLHTEKELRKFYTDLDFDNIIESSIFKKLLSRLSELHSNMRAKSRAKEINESMKKGYVLEIGPAKGELLNYLKKQGWNVNGVELSKYFTKYAKDKYNIDYIKKPNKKFDLILLFHVIEHVADPLKELKNLKKLLKPNGKIIIEVPNVPNDIKTISKEDAESEFSSIHIFHFRTKTFEFIAKKLNMKVEKIQRLTHKGIFEDSIYELHPVKNRKFSPIKLFKLVTNGSYLLISHLFDKGIYKEIENWENIDYTGYSDVIRVILTL